MIGFNDLMMGYIHLVGGIPKKDIDRALKVIAQDHKEPIIISMQRGIVTVTYITPHYPSTVDEEIDMICRWMYRDEAIRIIEE